jgi:hypothetical protein
LVIHIDTEELQVLYSYFLENEYYNNFRNEIPPAELDTLSFMKDFKLNTAFASFRILPRGTN